MTRARLRTRFLFLRKGGRGHGRRATWLGPALLATALAFNAILLAPELRGARLSWNDSIFHIAAAERLGQSLASGEPLLDPWMSESSLGYPVWRTYQPLPHLVAAGVFRITRRWMSSAAAYAALQYVLVALLPLTTYAGARLLGLGPLGCGLASLLILAPAGTGDFARYGLGYGSAIRSGSGLYTQLFAMHFLLLCLGSMVRSLDTGSRRATASILLAATALSHLIFGYVAFLSAALLAVVGPAGERSRRLVRVATVALPSLLLLAWFAVPMLLAGAEVNHSRWEPLYKWESFGAQAILRGLWSGNLLDGGRLPALTLLVAAGALTAAWSFKEAPARRLLSLALLWLILFFGSATWGRLLTLLAIPASFHLHRLQAAFEVSAVLLAAWGIERALRAAAAESKALLAGAVAVVAGALIVIGTERADFINASVDAGEANLRAYEQERSDLENALAAVRAILAERPGRASAGRRATWGDDFRIGDLPIFAFMTLAHVDQVSFLFHAMSLTSDVMELRSETDPAHDAAFGVRAVIAPVSRPPEPHWRPRGQYGRLAVYECSPEGYFGLADIGGRYTGPRSTQYEPSAAWLASDWLRAGVVLALGDAEPSLPAVARWQKLPDLSAALLTQRGRILRESKEGETYRAHLLLDRPCHAVVKITWHPDLTATVDGQPAPVLKVTPGFAAVPVSAGAHDLEMRYAPKPLKAFLLAFGILAFAAVIRAVHTPAGVAAQNSAAALLARLSQRLATPRITSAGVLFGLMLLALHALFRGQLIDGHDAIGYPPRLVEFVRALSDGQIPPLWAPDLANGYGQPLFEFAPPLLYAAAAALLAAGCGLTDSLQVTLAGLCAAGAIAVYGLGRRSSASRAAALGGSAAWLFAPYLATDLHVRAAFAEAAGVALAPVALLGVFKVLDAPGARRLAAGALSVALVPLAHNAVALLMLPAYALVILTHRSWLARARGTAALGMGLALSAFFWLPALIEKDFVKTDLLREGYLHWSVHAISPVQLWWSPWGYGYSVPGPADGMSFGLGPAHVLLAVLGLVVVFRSQDAGRRREAMAFALAALAGAWLATSWSAPVWSGVETLRYLTHPWRALLLPATFLPLLAVPALDWLRQRTRLVVVIGLVALNLAHTAPKGFLIYDEEYYAPDSIAARGISTTTYEEYEPRWVSTRPPYTAERLTGHPPLDAVRTVSRQSSRQEFVAVAAQSTLVEAATFYYPGWSVRIDGQEAAVDPVPGRGTISFRLPPGTHRIVLDLQPTPLRRFASRLSLAAAAALVLLTFLKCLRPSTLTKGTR